MSRLRTHPGWRRVVLLTATLLPQRAKRLVYGALGYRVHPTATIGLSFIEADEVTIGAHARVGHLNAITALRRFNMGEHSVLRDANIISGALYPDWARSFELAAGALVMTANYFDVGGRLKIGAGATIGGRSTQIWTHEFTEIDGVPTLTWSEVRIGAHSYVGARCLIMPRAELNESCTLGAGSVLTASVAGHPPRSLLVGSPARVASRPLDDFPTR